MEKKKELNPIEEQELDQVAGGYISPWEICQDRLLKVEDMSCYKNWASEETECAQDHKN